MFLLIASLLLAPSAPADFPERAPALIEACLVEAVAEDRVSETENRHKYICAGPAAERFWAFLEQANVQPWEQDTGADGRWLSRGFPLGGCFKRIRMADGSPATDGLSCSIWIPRPAR
jgi:hypothetical protein